MEIFAGIHIHGFNPTEGFAETLLCCFGQKCLLLFIIIKERHLYTWKKIHSTLENHENCKSLAQWIFSRLWYICT